MSTIVLQLAVAGVLGLIWVAVEWCRNRRIQVQLALSEMDEFQRASMAVIKDMAVPLDIVEFVVAVGRHIDNPEMARHVVRRIGRGRSDRQGRQLSIESLQDKALENFSKVVVYGALLSASHDLFKANRLRSIILFALTKPGKPPKASPAKSSVKWSTFDPLEPLRSRRPVVPVGAVDIGRAPEIAPELVAC